MTGERSPEIGNFTTYGDKAILAFKHQLDFCGNLGNSPDVAWKLTLHNIVVIQVSGNHTALTIMFQVVEDAVW